MPSAEPATVAAGPVLVRDSFFIVPQNQFKYKYRGGCVQGNTVRQYFYNFTGSTVDYLDFMTHEHVRLFSVPEVLSNELEGIGTLSPDTVVFLLNSGIALYSPQGQLLRQYAFTGRERKRAVWDNIYSPLLVTPTGYAYSRTQSARAVLGYYSVPGQKAYPIPIAFPAPRKGNAGTLGEHSQAYFHNQVAVLFNVSPDLYVYDLAEKTVSKHSVKSAYDTGFVPFTGGDMRDVHNHNMTTGYYYNVSYDPYRDEVLVIYMHPQPLKNAEGYYNDDNTRSASIIVLDGQLQRKREYVFPLARYGLFMLAYPTPEGLVVRVNQTKADLQQNGMKYHVLQLN